MHFVIEPGKHFMLKRLIFAVAMLAWVPTARAGTLDSVRQKGFVSCGVNVGLGGFSMPDSKGVWRGLDVDACRAVSAAVFRHPEQARCLPTTGTSRSAAPQSAQH